MKNPLGFIWGVTLAARVLSRAVKQDGNLDSINKKAPSFLGAFIYRIPAVCYSPI